VSFAKDEIDTVVTMLLAILLAAGPFVFGCGSLVASTPPRGGGGWKKCLLLFHCLASCVNAGERIREIGREDRESRGGERYVSLVIIGINAYTYPTRDLSTFR
jgi:hypothetical protein